MRTRSIWSEILIRTVIILNTYYYNVNLRIWSFVSSLLIHHWNSIQPMNFISVRQRLHRTLLHSVIFRLPAPSPYCSKAVLCASRTRWKSIACRWQAKQYASSAKTNTNENLLDAICPWCKIEKRKVCILAANFVWSLENLRHWH